MWQKTVIVIFLISVFLKTEGKFRSETIYMKHDGINRSFELFVPKNYSAAKSYPVVFILHGGGGTGKGLERHTMGRFNRLAEKDEFVAVYPNGFEKSWNDGARDTFGVARKMNIDDVGFIEKILDNIGSKLNVDKKNIFACGISNGGFMVQRLAFELPEKIRGIAVVAANLSEVQAKKEYPEKPVSVLFINGTDDPLVPYNGGHVTVFRQNRGKVLSMEKTIETWKKINGCEELVKSEALPDRNQSDGCRAFKITWENPENEFVRVVALKIEEGGHTWPGTTRNLTKRLVGNTCHDFNGCDEIWDFFKSISDN